MDPEYRLEYFNLSVKEEIESWPVGILAGFVRITQSMVNVGPNMGMPFTRPMGEGLFEIRAKGPEGIGRAFFCTLVEKRRVILHGFIKKSEKTPDRELSMARKRAKEVLVHEKNKKGG